MDLFHDETVNESILEVVLSARCSPLVYQSIYRPAVGEKPHPVKVHRVDS